MENISAQTCIKFRRTYNRTEPHHCIERTGTLCKSFVGYSVKGHGQINISKKCMKEKDIQHILLHALGFLHIHMVADRDKYVRIVRENIREGYEHNFDNFPKVTDFGDGYDYNSLLHYERNQFSKNRKPTIVALKKDIKLGGAKGLSSKDIEKLKKVYC